MNSFIDALQQLVNTMQEHAIFALEIIALLWIIQGLNYLVHYRLNVLGIYPRHVSGLIGIFFAPLLHGHSTHLFFNSIPLFLLLTLMLNKGVEPFMLITLNIAVLGGLATWLFGRKARHVGSSGVIMGYMGYLLMQAYFSPSVSTLILGALALYYCGSILLHLIPSDEKSSWEGHIFGFVAGAVVAYGWTIIPPSFSIG